MMAWQTAQVMEQQCTVKDEQILSQVWTKEDSRVCLEQLDRLLTSSSSPFSFFRFFVDGPASSAELCMMPKPHISLCVLLMSHSTLQVGIVAQQLNSTL